MKTIRQVLESKGNDVITIRAAGTVYEALELMAANNVGASIVLEGEKMVGIISERDYARKVILRGDSSLKLRVRSIMSKDIFSVTPTMTVDQSMTLITENRCRHLPVIDDDKLVGLVSIGDLVKVTLEEKEQLIKQLENYIATG